ncbi:bifunctional folylpolyglutamate synthase/dihydrofolate synthase [Sphingomonas astaxanthinifaciens]|uniref:Dihydrofolate synthase/folylpolyglutamate synthase n=1 Tax=Sphingomonas astaxanthinifaciens DSM 22298 TaxID=1123267 RepID=A0ABQ5Z9C9_9SPHN|nr:folylpolyglutamate synthase/dihydrofolate synthase family protein [Sphingomonas astaxanthinifaciens]GLR47379.1 bifunctional folylpolyglutamate synthase/dihydrofolate synthase [Sphingomonas astaxanthinifaciens DSM 22298]
MADGARSDHPGVQGELDRLAALSPGGDRLGLERIEALLARLGHPERQLPPVFHVAGTNGKGSTCAFLRTALEAAGHRVHVFTSPHLVRFNERIRLAGRLVEDELLAALLAEVLDASDGIGPSFFEATAAAALLAFARTPADALVLEVGMGGRLDATNVVARPTVTGIAALGLDHQQWLGEDLADIAGEKAGIAKADVPLVTLAHPAEAASRVRAVAARVGAPLFVQGEAWDSGIADGRLRYRDRDGALDLPLPALPGPHQADNASLAIAMLRHQQALAVPAAALERAMTDVRWPARLQKLRPGPLIGRRDAWLDGGHNPQAAEVLAESIAALTHGRPLHLVTGMLSTKDAAGLLTPFRGLVEQVHAIGFDHPLAFPAEDLAATARDLGLPASAHPSIADALAHVPADRPALIAGSLYLAGEVLALNGEAPD